MAQSCPHCGTELEPTDQFCTGCLADFGPPPEPQVGRTTTQRVELVGETLSVILFGVFFGGLVAFGAYKVCTGLIRLNFEDVFFGGLCVVLPAIPLIHNVKTFRKALRSKGPDTPQ